MTIAIGSTVWVFDSNHRVYRRDAEGRAVGGPIAREHFRPRTVIGETSRSWVLDNGLEVPKVGGDIREAPGGPYGKRRVYMTQKTVDDASWLEENAWALGEHLRRITDADLLRKVAGLVGYVERDKAAADAAQGNGDWS